LALIEEETHNQLLQVEWVVLKKKLKLSEDLIRNWQGFLVPRFYLSFFYLVKFKLLLQDNFTILMRNCLSWKSFIDWISNFKPGQIFPPSGNSNFILMYDPAK
jgi:hypothetical protein